MKKAFLTILVMAFAYCSLSATSFSENPNIYPANTNLSESDFLKLKTFDYRKLIGRRLTLKESIALKIVQRKIRKAERKNGTIDIPLFYNKDKKPFKWHWGGFFLGLFLPFIGLLIAGIIKKDDRKWDRINSAAIATAIVSIVFIFIVLKSFANSL